ncbi:uncharacterized protein LOC128334745 [Hemicordylus capensis]|uniref:uncharacterized protein LOC128334745 n=1 Tax=Hemicordylus capensis TaxID=884348 RepID=UPI002303D25C|nr:uncharacterized protein LOC128334745 [Hemicordylus capensis]
MLFVVVLIFLKEATGDTFFIHHDGQGPKELVCKRATKAEDRIAWYAGTESMQTLNLMSCAQGGNILPPRSAVQPVNSSTNFDLHCKKKASIVSFSTGGVFACKSLRDNRMEYTYPLFSNSTHCSIYDFFIVAVPNRTAEEKIFEESSEPLRKSLSVDESDSFTLDCRFQLNDSSLTFVVYWIKDTSPNTCLHSVANEGGYVTNFSYDVNCCVDATIKERQEHHSSVNGSQHWHNITIFNATSSDSGTYFCIVSAWSFGKHIWKTASELSVKVGNHKVPWLLITLGAIGGFVLIGGITWFFCWKKNSQGKSGKQDHRDPPTVELEGDECTPYAVCSRNDIGGNEVLYSLAMSPGWQPDGAPSLQDGKTGSKIQLGEDGQALYAVVNK